MKNIQDLYSFIDRAAKSHKYPDNTAWAIKSALKKFEQVLNEEEKASIKMIQENLDPLTQKLYNKDQNTSAGSLATYKSRVQKVISDFEKYGNDASKMANWTVKTVLRAKKQSPHTVNTTASESENTEHPTTQQNSMARIELPLREGMKFLLVVPQDISEQERVILKGIIDSINPSRKA